MNQNEIPSHYKCKANKGELGFMVMNAISVRRGLQVNRLEFKFRRYKLDLGEKIPGFNGTRVSLGILYIIQQVYVEISVKENDEL